MRSINGNRGFSIIEMMVAIAVATILLVIAVPAFRSTSQRGYVSSGVSALMGDLQYARAEAAARHKYVSFCPSTDGASCVDSTTLETGWLIYAYDGGSAGPNQNYSATATPAHQLLKVYKGDNRSSIRGLDGKVLTFNQSGLPVANGTRVADRFVICARTQPASTSVGLNQAVAPGSAVAVKVSGGLVASKLVAGAACTP